MAHRHLALLLAAASMTAADPFVEWNPAVDVAPDAGWRLPVEPVPVDGPRVVAADGHFFLRGQRFRAWGVNLSFGANLPAADDAARVADRLAAAGVNAVRMHHMDTARYPRGLWHRDGGRRLDPEALGRLDRFVAELARHGIRINLNLHVGARYSAMLGELPESELPESPINYDKLCLQFVPELQQAWCDYARMLLDHRNPERGGLRYADDPAIAWVEVSNENSFWFGGHLDQLRDTPGFYRSLLDRQFAGWLRGRYGDDAGLRRAWDARAEPLGADLLSATGAPWVIERHQGAAAALTAVEHGGEPGVRLEPQAITGEGWHLQYNVRPVRLEKGKYYTLSFSARADRPRRVQVAVNMAHEPWGPLGLSAALTAGPEWKAHRLGFVAAADDAAARVTFSFGSEKVPLELAGIRLQPGGQLGVAAGESLRDGRVALWGESETPERSNDRLRFLAATEKGFFDMARGFIRGVLGCGALVVGTQGYGPLGLYAQDGMDFIDTHAYWQHPHFPRRPWDQGDWTIGRRAMVDEPRAATFLDLASHRVPGRPFTVSEYNHPAPNDFQVECVPMMAAIAAVEDWDGVWFYTFEHENSRWDEPRMTGFFDLRGNPAKWAFMPAAAALFRGASIAPAGGSFLSTLVPPAPEASWRDPAAALDAHRFNCGGRGLPPEQLARRLYGGDGGDGGGLLLVEGDGGAVAVGHAAALARRTSVLRIESPGFFAAAVAAMDGGRKEDARRLLLTACGRAENPGMKFNDARTSVGRDWGGAPVRAEAVSGSLRLPDGEWRAWALRPDGTRGREVAVERENGAPVLRMSPEHGTICYWLER